MIITKMALPRRTFLRGVGATLALPMLDAMVPAFGAVSAAAKPVKRLGFVYIPMGSNIAEWTPKQEGRLTELSPTLGSLTPYLSQTTVLSNLELKNAYSSGNHATANCTTDYGTGLATDRLPDGRTGCGSHTAAHGSFDVAIGCQRMAGGEQQAHQKIR